jgi:DNA-binding NarL/FixJ family response regulator
VVSHAITVAVHGRSPIDQAALEALVQMLPGLTVVPETAVPPPQVLLWDSGLDDLDAIPDHAPDTAVLILVKHADNLEVPVDVVGIFAKDETPAALGIAIRQISRGQQYLSPQVALALLRRPQEMIDSIPADLDSLTQREREILMQLSEGLSNKAIAARLYLSVRTVEGHLANLYSKLNVHSRTEAALIAIQLRAER